MRFRGVEKGEGGKEEGRRKSRAEEITGVVEGDVRRGMKEGRLGVAQKGGIEVRRK